MAIIMSNAEYEQTMREYRDAKVEYERLRTAHQPRPAQRAAPPPHPPLHTRLCLLARGGPAVFKVCEAGRPGVPLVVTLGSTHVCTCKRGKGCPHIRWVLTHVRCPAAERISLTMHLRLAP